MRITTKQIIAAILCFDIVMGLLLCILYGNKLLEKINLYETHPAASKFVVGNPISKEGKTTEILKETDYKKIALTFDDGPHPYYTEQLLDGLKEREVVVTFFVTGEHAVLHPEVIKRMEEEGHTIGNHTYSHMQLRSNNREKFKEELILTNEVLEEITGNVATFVRPPYGTWDKSLEAELNLIPVLWTVDPLDWCSGDAGCVTRRVMEEVEENDIILMHDYYETSVTAALAIVDELIEDGYLFVSVEEILFE